MKLDVKYIFLVFLVTHSITGQSQSKRIQNENIIKAVNIKNSTANQGNANLKNNFLSSGMFIIGANYWASHAGTAMWTDWHPDIVEKDLKKLSEAGIKILRIFPIWSVFQSITLLREFKGKPMEYRMGEELLTDDPEGKSGISKIAIEHFDEFVSLAERYDIKLIVGLITGWMSGRLFVPPALDGMNLLTDPEAIMWEVRFVNYFVSRYKNSSAIIAWDLGNECECLSPVSSPSAAWNWTSSITNAIKSVDNSRLVISGIATRISDNNEWHIQDIAETTDILTTHSYQIFTPYAEQEPLNTIRPILATVIQNLCNENIGGKPSFIEEFGTLGPLLGTDGNDGVKSGFLRCNLFSQWAYNCRGLLWWCAFDQGNLTQTPYDWNSRGSEYGLWYPDGKPKPVLDEIKSFSNFLSGFKYTPLPERIIDGVCILTPGQDEWAVAYSSFLLAKQAGLDIEFQQSTQPLKESKLYFLPSVKGAGVISRHRMQELLEKIKNGAVLYISNDDGNIGPFFPDFTGLNVISYTRSTVADIVSLTDLYDKKTSLEMKTDKKLILATGKAKILGTDQNGYPAFTCMNYGKGKVFFLNYPLEKYLATKVGAFDGQVKNSYWKIYSHFKNRSSSLKVVSVENTNIGITEHPLDQNRRLVIAVNYCPSMENVAFKIEEGWKVSQMLYGKGTAEKRTSTEVVANISINRNNAVVFAIERISDTIN